MCDIDEMPWPPCDPAPFTSVNNKSCIIIKAKSEFKVELKQFMNSFEDNYNRALAYFYAQEAEQKARMQNKLLTEYIAQLRKYQQDITAGVLDAKRPKAPPEIYSEDPLDCVGECFSGMVTIGSVSIESESSIDLEYIEQKKLVSLDTLEILKKSSDSRESLRQVSSKNFRRRARKGTLSSDISKSNSVQIISKVSAKSLQSSKACSRTRQSIQAVEEKPISQRSWKNVKDNGHLIEQRSSTKQLRPANSNNKTVEENSISRRSRRNFGEKRKSDEERSSTEQLKMASSDDETMEDKLIPQSSRRNLEEKCNSDKQRSPSKQLSLTNSDNEVQVGSDGNTSDWSISDYQTAGEEVPNEITVKENSRAGDEERDAISPKAVSRSHSSTSLLTNGTQATDSDEIINELHHVLQELDTRVNLKNEELKEAINSKLPMLNLESLEDVDAMMAEERNLQKKVSNMRTKLTQLDELALEPIQLKDFCENLTNAMSSKTAEKLFGNNTEKSRRTLQSSLSNQQVSYNQFPIQLRSRNNLAEQVNQTRPYPSQNFSQSTFCAQTNSNQGDCMMPQNFGSDNYTRQPPKSLDASQLQKIISQVSQLMKRQNASNHNAPINEFSLPDFATSTQAPMNATYDKIIGKLLHQTGSIEGSNFMRPISIASFNVSS